MRSGWAGAVFGLGVTGWAGGCAPEQASPPHVAPLDTGDPGPLTAELAVSENPSLTLERRFDYVFSRPGKAVLRCTSPDDPDEDHRLTLAGTVGSASLYGLLAATHYTCALTASAGDPLWSGDFTTAPLGPDFPTFTVSRPDPDARVASGYLLFSHWRTGGAAHRLVVTDPAGAIRWYQDFPEASTGGIAATWLGDQLVAGGGGVSPSLRDLSGGVSFAVAPPREPDPTNDVYNHEAAWTPLGVLSLQAVTDSDETASWKGFRIEVTDPATAAVVWSFDSADARRAGLLPPGTPTEDDPYHANAVAWRDDDPQGPSVWVSLRAQEALLRIDRETGALSFFGHDRGIALVDPQGRALPDSEWFWGEHDPSYTGNQLTIYDNGGARDVEPKYSRVVQYLWDGGPLAVRTYAWTEPGWFEPNFGGATPLPNGHLLIATGHCARCENTSGDAGHGWILELDPATAAVAWRLDFTTPDDSTYRAQFVAGCGLFANARFCPGLAR